MEYLVIIKMVAPWVIAGATAFGGVKVGLNGQREKLNGVATRLDTHIEAYHKDSRTIVRSLSSLDTKVNLLVQHKIKE